MPAYSPDKTVILIVDDDIAAIRFLSNILKDLGSVLFATNGRDGIEMAKLHHPHLILLDIQMSEMGGFDVCRYLKNDFDTRDCAVMFATASVSTEIEIACLDAGAVDFVTKPFNPPLVRARVRTHLRLQHDAQILEHQSKEDFLTGLYNRRYFEQLVENEFKRGQRQKTSLGLALIDIDFFKNYNGAYGHPAGDAALKQVANAIKNATKRPGETVVRWGGEEFAVLLPFLDNSELEQYGAMLCEEIRCLQITHDHSKCSQWVTVSIGLALIIPSETNSIKYLVDQADLALYKAKDSGRNQVVLGV
ncbi:GGDEF domain-containing response regulator [Undibacterium sp. Xuan67W]|uniref:GGDEF domain-containing response regulator n=1 Tax=Undibacterium sp. Xuan67W TaxID=3413057 RepID=UPI003BF110F2